MADTCPFEILPYKSTNIQNRPTPVNLNYTNQDFWSMKARLISFIKERFGNEFNDFVESSLALMLIENWSFIADTLSFKIDQIANEVFIDTVRASVLVYPDLSTIPYRSIFSYNYYHARGL